MSGTTGREPLPAVTAQIAELEGRGIAFGRCSKSEAERVLHREAGYGRVLPLLGLFPQLTKDEGGERGGDEGLRDGAAPPGVGVSGGVDFADLLALLRLDDELRGVFGALALDVERLAKLRLLDRIVEDPREDGYAIVGDYRATMNQWTRRKLAQEIGIKRKRRDPYFASLAVDLASPLSVRSLLDLLVFGQLVDFCLFCAMRWDDASLKTDYQMLKRVKEVRNATAHGLNLVHGLTPSNQSRLALAHQISARYGQTALRGTWRRCVRNATTLDLVTLLWVYRKYADDYQRTRARSRLVALRERFEGVAGLLPRNYAVEYLRFIFASAEAFGLA